MENIGLANVFHEFIEFHRFLAGPRTFSGKPQIHGKHWPGQCFPLFIHRNSWKTLARPMFSMNFGFFLDSWLVPGDSLENHKFMENIGQANVFHEFPRKKTMENIGQAKVFHEFIEFHRFLAGPRRFSEKPQIYGKHWPGQCFPLFFNRNSWKTLARQMFSMNFWFFIHSWLIPGDSLKNHKFMENIGQANVFHCFFTGIHGKHWPGQCFP